LRDALLSVVVLVAILGASALVTNWFARTMYIRCQSCGTLNARRRLECRACGQVLKKT
jgi:ribosomal protein S27E